MANQEIVADFIKLIERNEWRDSRLTEQDERVVLAILKDAGHEADKITPGTLLGDYRDQDGARGEKYKINSLFPYKVLREKADDSMATGWLNNFVQLATTKSRHFPPNKLALELSQQVDASRPLEAIRLTSDGDELVESNRRPQFGGYEYFVHHARDTDMIGSCIHAYCGGSVERRGATRTHDALVCKHCFLRVLFPKEVKTYGELRKALADAIARSTP